MLALYRDTVRPSAAAPSCGYPSQLRYDPYDRFFVQQLDGRLVHSASDLNAFSECLHLTALERERAGGRIVRPPQDNATADLLARKGEAHEQHYLARLRAIYGDALVAFEERPLPSRAAYAAAERESIAAMQRGAAMIYQATFFDGTFLGRADFLRRVDRPSARWPWSYEVVDTKLALSTRPYFLVQLCNYSEHIERIAGTAPQYASIVLGTGKEQQFRIDEFAAYYRRLKDAYLASMDRGADAYPVECAHCDVCPWRAACASRREADDHLSLVAGIRGDQIGKLEAAGISTLGALATARGETRPKHLAPETFVNLQAQAGEQHRYRVALAATGVSRHTYTFRSLDDEHSGFGRLPEPNAGDVFFDMEGDPLYRPDRALEYLFGIYLPAEDRYVPFWGTTPADERRAFEAFVDFVVARRISYPALHVYHYAPYETTALKRLMGRFASREDDIDRLLRAQVFIDLYPVVKQAVWISQPSYSIKKLEALYGFERRTVTRGGDDSIVMFESWLETQDDATLEDIRAYNEDDCRSTFRLRQWLVELRAERNLTLHSPIAWRAPAEPLEPAENAERSELERTLLDGLTPPDSMAELRSWSAALRGRWLLGNLIAYHRREQKPEWWEHFYRIEHPTELVDADRKALGGLTRCRDIERYPLDRGFVYTYRFPDQEHDLGARPIDVSTGKSAGQIVDIDDSAGLLQIKLARAIEPDALTALIPDRPLNDRQKREAIAAIAAAYADATLGRDFSATLGLLLANRPRLKDRLSGAQIQPEPVSADAISTVIQALDRSHLVVQGPPGTGKSTTAAHVIVDLLVSGQRVALAAQSHKALHSLLRKVEQTAAARGVTFSGCHKSTASNVGSAYVSCVDDRLVKDAPDFGASASCALVSATTFAWANPDYRGAFDVVFIDEAGQISLADALVTSLIARNVVLLGDPQQLPQVSQGYHPIGTDLSILEHLLGTHATIPADCGIFLDTSYRMQPQIDSFVSSAFYDRRLRADPLNAKNRVTSAGRVMHGPRFLAVSHEGNARRSIEEADEIVAAIGALLADGTVTIRDRPVRQIVPADILVVAPYNAQRVAISERLERHGIGGIGVGTVDKFQGQEAPIVFYSMTTSSADLAPRGLDFLLSPNRLNVAISRAQAVSMVVSSPHLLASRAASIEQMRMLSLLCSYVEYASAERAVTLAEAG